MTTNPKDQSAADLGNENVTTANAITANASTDTSANTIQGGHQGSSNGCAEKSKPEPYSRLSRLLREEEKASLANSMINWSGPYCHPNRVAYRPRLAYWAYRIAVLLPGFDLEFGTGDAQPRALAQLMGVPLLAQKGVSRDEALQALREVHASGALYPAMHVSSALPTTTPTADVVAGEDADAERPVIDQGATPPVGDCPLKRNLDWITRTAKLSPAQAAVLELGVCMRAFSTLAVVASAGIHKSVSDHYYSIAGLLELDPMEVKEALQSDSILTRCALIDYWTYGVCQLDTFLRAPRGLVHKMEHHDGDPSLLLSDVIVPLKSPSLSLANFSHMQEQTALAQAWLSGTLASAALGVENGKGKNGGGELGGHGGHLLIAGEPGLGKTEWVRALLNDAGVLALEMAVFNHVGLSLTGSERLRNLSMSMRFLSHTAKAVLVFDEADDVFLNQSERLTTEKGDDSAVSMLNHRASLNHLIENAQLPVIWIMNEPEVLDPAVLRRFDAVIGLKNMPRKSRLELLKDYFAQSKSDGDAYLSRHAIPSPELERWADIAELTPALIARLAAVRGRALAAGQVFDATTCRQWLIQRLSDRAIRSMRHGSGVKTQEWNPQTVNASVELSSLIAGIQKHPHARVLLHGIPGTGKTAYAHALAKALGKPLMERRASDLLSAYLGASEQNIRDAFDRAGQDGSVLFLDEADSLLAPREGARHSWEVTQTNELLVQLHDFEGVAVLATNRMEGLDGAVLRRMDVKVQFLPLKVSQSKILLEQLVGQCLGAQEVIAISADHVSALGGMTALTPGDFALLRRRMRFAPLQSVGADETAKELIGLLESEVRLKTGGRVSMGFVFGDYSQRPIDDWRDASLEPVKRNPDLDVPGGDDTGTCSRACFTDKHEQAEKAVQKEGAANATN